MNRSIGDVTYHYRFLFWPKVIEGTSVWMSFVTKVKHWDTNPETGSAYVSKVEWRL